MEKNWLHRYGSWTPPDADSVPLAVVQEFEASLEGHTAATTAAVKKHMGKPHHKRRRRHRASFVTRRRRSG
jgi:hypothetical protein